MTLTAARIAAEGKPYWHVTEHCAGSSSSIRLRIHGVVAWFVRRNRHNGASAAAFHEQNISARPLEIPVLQPILDLAQAVAPAVRRAACFDLFARGTGDELERVGRFVFLLVQRRD
ncbi:hypothetical protein CBA19CS11_28115 [Caballeronia novacaledonica]|uniref:hypothetical protein n=1 Tax=Caballeronia novacaledonica TaxID=1544861 RepID=UPI001EE36AF9|nr:hypothetical protein [Caballeronia novacaledonica]GJH12783.1 hypothetical protein CBA19CS11_28115 [Caballeronia novacaledonica]